MKPIDDIFIVGTDTGVGKSVVSLLLMQLLFSKGHHPFYFKPFQTGCETPYDADSDAKFIYDHTAALKGQDPAQSMLYCYANPKAPYFAASDAGDTIDAARVQQRAVVHKKDHSPMVIEAAGGLLVPVTRELLMVDWVGKMNCRPLLVARAGLGTINHTLLSLEALRQRQIVPLGVVFVDAAQVPSDKQLIRENILAVEMCAQVRVAGVISRLADFSAPPLAAYKVFEQMLF